MELQPRQTFFIPSIRPGQDSGMRLSGGVTIPYYYSMSSRCTCPYVEISGGTKSNKLLSWGEVIMVPPGEQLTVKNLSYHTGDIAINSGQDWVEMPTRITVPVPWAPGTDPRVIYRPLFPVDCRRAKRAYATISMEVNAPVPILIQGFNRESSFITGTDSGDNVPIPSPSWFGSLTMPAFTQFGTFPLGLNPVNNISPMTLLDTASFLFQAPPATIVPNIFNNLNLCFYTLEY